MEAGAGDAAGFPDAAYVEKGARIVASRAEALKAAEILLQVRPLRGPDAIFEGITPRHVTVGFLDPLASPKGVQAFAARGATAFALELLPRTTRAQAMDVLSSAATVVGYKAVLLAAGALPRMFPMMMTAGGTLTPARVFVIGGGVAGLQAIATARRLGAVVQAYDVRPAVKEQVESLGGKFVELPIEAGDAQDAGGYAKAMDESFYRRQREMMAKVIAGCDVVISTAAVPGQEGAGADHRGDGGRHAAGLGRRRRGRGAGRQLRGHARGRERRAQRGDGDGAGEPRRHRAVPREPDVRPQRLRRSWPSSSRTAR